MEFSLNRNYKFVESIKEFAIEIYCGEKSASV